MTPRSPLWKRCLTAPLILIASLVMWIEESLWEWFKWLTAQIALLAWVRKIESWIQSLSPYATMVVFFLPLLILIPFKLVAVYWMASGHWITSIVVIITAKLVGTAIEARMFVVCKAKLLTIPWFRRLHDGLVAIHHRLQEALHSLAIYQAVRTLLIRVKALAKSVLHRIRGRWRMLRVWFQRTVKP
ncbi:MULTISPECIES: hypothetical protein [unclassified Schlesneria]|uniref:hypothetical protein n=1 Tax=unclassified Schlesneria TaxID=2762017 RepID=UPI002F12CF72